MRYFVLLVFLLILGCSSNGFVKINNEVVNVEIARSIEERREGLMFREELCEDCGMLFVFEDSGPKTFWMKNTLIPLDMIFINENLEIVNIEKAVPCENDACDLYKSKRDAKYVLEVNAGFSEKRGIKVGDKVEI